MLLLLLLLLLILLHQQHLLHQDSVLLTQRIGLAAAIIFPIAFLHQLLVVIDVARRNTRRIRGCAIVSDDD